MEQLQAWNSFSHGTASGSQVHARSLLIWQGEDLLNAKTTSHGAPCFSSESPCYVTPARLMTICKSGLFDFRDSCVLGLWSAVPPAVLALLFVITCLPLPHVSGLVAEALDLIKGPVQPFITLPEAEALVGVDQSASPSASGHLGDADTDVEHREARVRVPLWRTVALSGFALFESLIWLAVGSFRIVTAEAEQQTTWESLFPILLALSWLYASFRPIVHPSNTPPYDLVSLYVVHLFGAVSLFGAVLYEISVTGETSTSLLARFGLVANIFAVLGLLAITFQMPLDMPSSSVSPEQIVRVLAVSLNVLALTLFRAKRYPLRIIPHSGVGSHSTGFIPLLRRYVIQF
jgi:hypothetical protein